MGEIVFTLQTFAIAITLFLLGGKAGSSCIFIYLVMGGIGVPVFAGLQGGISSLLGPTGGFILGFGLWGGVYWLLTTTLGRKFRMPAMFIGLILCYALGSAWICFFYGYPYIVAVAKCVLPFILPDCVKIVLAWFLAKRLKRFVY